MQEDNRMTKLFKITERKKDQSTIINSIKIFKKLMESEVS